MRYFLIAGEPSGDMHGANLITEIKRLDASAEFVGMGGDKMESQGLKLVNHINSLSIMGFWEVITKICTLLKLFRKIKASILEFQPDFVVLIDYGGFNLRIAKFAHRKKIPVHFYILPKVWAWNEGRIKKIKRYVDKGYVIFPFEENYFRKGGVDAIYVGNPVVRSIQNFRLGSFPEERIANQIALLPGSRDQELKRILPKLLSIASSFSNYHFVIAAAQRNKHIPTTLPSNVSIVYNKTYSVLQSSRMAIVTSGTANLETALLHTPQIVVYQASPISYYIAKHLVKIKYISPVNLILNELACPELIQNDFNKVNLTRAVERCLQEQVLEKMKEHYLRLETVLGFNNAPAIVAECIVKSTDLNDKK